MFFFVRDLNVSYGKARVLHDISIVINAGEIVSIVGRNGAGKTTLLKTVAGFLKPESGTIHFNGMDIQSMKPDVIARMGIRYVFQDKRVFGDLTVRENLELAAYPFKASVDEAVEILCTMSGKMKKLLDSKAKTLSGGERQILLISRALVGNPKLLLIDEPTEGLAAKVVEEITKILSDMKGKMTMVVVEQNLSLVQALSDRVYILKEGVIGREIDDLGQIRRPGTLECMI